MSLEAPKVNADPLTVIRSQLLQAAQAARIRAHRRHRRRTIAAGLLTMGCLAVGTASAATGDFTTGVAAIDRLLSVDGPADVQSGSMGTSEPIAIPRDGGRLYVSAYSTDSGAICVAQSLHSDSDTSGAAEGGLGGCVQRQELVDKLQRGEIVWATALLLDKQRIFVGYAPSVASDVRVRQAKIPTSVKLAPAWRPDGAPQTDFKVLAVYDRAPELATSNSTPSDDDLTALVQDYPMVDAVDDEGHPLRNRSE
jgi:hypothetical protein